MRYAQAQFQLVKCASHYLPRVSFPSLPSAHKEFAVEVELGAPRAALPRPPDRLRRSRRVDGVGKCWPQAAKLFILLSKRPGTNHGGVGPGTRAYAGGAGVAADKAASAAPPSSLLSTSPCFRFRRDV